LIAVLAVLVVFVAGCGSEPTAMATIIPPSPSPTTELLAVALPTPTEEPTRIPDPSLEVPPTVTPEPTPTPLVYMVAAGDTLIAIALRYGVTLGGLQQANPGLQPELLQIGQRVTIPEGGADRQAGQSAPATATPAPLRLDVMHLGLHETPAGGLWVLGEVHNATTRSAGNVQLLVGLEDLEGTLVVSRTVWLALDLVFPGGSAPFAALFDSVTVSDPQVSVQIVGAESSGRDELWHPAIEVMEHQGSESGHLYRVTGAVQNRGAENARDVEVLVTLYDAAGRVAGFRFQALCSDLAADATMPFDVVLSPAGLQVAGYSVTAVGKRNPN